MREADVMVVGGGPAGVSAAIEAAKSGLSVMLCEQRPALGGAIHRQPAEGAAPVAVLPSLRGRWQALSAELSASGVDPEKYTGWAFGMGPARMALARYGIPDIRTLYDSDVRFLQQFAR